MRAPIFKLDAFTGRRFSGNPAAVVLVNAFPTDDLMQAIAAENHVSETAFLVSAQGDYLIRWFTPTTEVPLCGHATLASAATIMERIEAGRTEVTFYSSSGPLAITEAGGRYRMNFPSRRSERVAGSAALTEALQITPEEVLANEFNYMAVFSTAKAVRTFSPDFGLISALDRSGVIITAQSDDVDYDIVSRYFAPAKGIPEDPVTGGAHCMLTPYWTERLGKVELRAFQASKRTGEMTCRLLDERVELEGTCVFSMEGTLHL